MAQLYPNGIDCVWLATDRDGHIGAFITGGVGPIPLQLLESADVPIVDVEEQIYCLPKISIARVLVQIERPDSFIDIAQRGLFVYDWRDVHRSAHDSTNKYEPVAVPENALTIEAAPEEIAALTAEVRLRNVAFGDSEMIDMHSQLRCVAE